MTSRYDIVVMRRRILGCLDRETLHKLSKRKRPASAPRASLISEIAVNWDNTTERKAMAAVRRRLRPAGAVAENDVTAKT